MPDRTTVCEQLARWWAQNSAASIPLVFCEQADLSSSANLFASSIPAKADRLVGTLSRAASIVVSSAQPTSDGMDPTTRIIVTITTRSDTRRDAERVLSDLRRLIRPANLPWAAPDWSAYGNQVRRGYIGAPPPDVFADGSSIDIWRVIGVEIVSDVQPLAIEAGEGSTEEGQGSAVMTLALRCVPGTLTAAAPALRIYNSTATHTSATVEVRGSSGIAGTVRLTHVTSGGSSVVTDLPLSPGDSVQDLIDGVNAVGSGWTADVPAGYLDLTASSALALELARPRGCLLIANAKSLRLWT